MTQANEDVGEPGLRPLKEKEFRRIGIETWDQVRLQNMFRKYGREKLWRRGIYSEVRTASTFIGLIGIYKFWVEA